MGNSTTAAITVFMAGIGLLGVATAQAAPGAGIKQVGMTLVSSRVQTLSASQVSSLPNSMTRGSLSPDKHTLTFSKKMVHLVVQSGPASDMLSYRIAGLRNPTLVVPAGATLKVLFINTDDDMMHNLRFTVQKPPFKGPVKSVGTISLAHKSMTAYHAEDLMMRVPTRAGTYTYLCTVPGHAPGGMYGTLIVR
jgi:rusticyanin